jgi:two-component system alkaline phosphatase synthesis response regulator PhoP/two-component system response regulator VicR
MAKRILAVDDEKNILTLVKINLERAGYEVTTANNGREALKAVEAELPDLIVLDIMMPEIDGLEVLRTLKADQKTSSIPVIMLTAKVQDEDVFKGWQSGAEVYLTKPFDQKQLLGFIERILEYSDEPESDEKVFELDEDATGQD